MNSFIRLDPRISDGLGGIGPAIAIFKLGLGATGLGFSVISASDRTLTLSTFNKSGNLSLKISTVALAIFAARTGSGSFTVTLTTLEFCALDTRILPSNCLAL